MLLVAGFVAMAAGAMGFGPGRAFRMEESEDGFGVRSHGIVEMAGGERKFFALPRIGDYEGQEVIGPHQVVGTQVWFGNNYYDGEGESGVGAFGYFDMDTRRYCLFAPPELRRWEVSALLVERDVVWLGLDRFVEDISTVPGGLIRWNRQRQTVERYELEFVVSGIGRRGGMLVLTTRDGYALFREGKVSRFLKSGAPIRKFAPPPSQY